MDMHQLTRIFCEIDDFCKELNRYAKGKFLPAQSSKKGPSCCLRDSEIMTILILFQSSRWRDFKNYYNNFLSIFHKKEFPTLPSYNRFIEIMKLIFKMNWLENESHCKQI